MKALIVDGEGRLSVEEISMPQIGPCQALVKMESCGVCNGTDRKLIHRTFKNFHTYPAILGHEGVGKVVKTGEFVENLHVGDRVLLPFLEEATDTFRDGAPMRNTVWWEMRRAPSAMGWALAQNSGTKPMRLRPLSGRRIGWMRWALP